MIFFIALFLTLVALVPPLSLFPFVSPVWSPSRAATGFATEVTVVEKEEEKKEDKEKVVATPTRSDVAGRRGSINLVWNPLPLLPINVSPPRKPRGHKENTTKREASIPVMTHRSHQQEEDEDEDEDDVIIVRALCTVYKPTEATKSSPTKCKGECHSKACR